MPRASEETESTPLAETEIVDKTASEVAPPSVPESLSGTAEEPVATEDASATLPDEVELTNEDENIEVDLRPRSIKTELIYP